MKRTAFIYGERLPRVEWDTFYGVYASILKTKITFFPREDIMPLVYASDNK